MPRKDEEDVLSEDMSERGERRQWTPRLASEADLPARPSSSNEATAPVAAFAAPPQDAAMAAVRGELLAVATAGLGEGPAAERVVAMTLQAERHLATTAMRAAFAAEREAALAELTRLVRRAALDALPPVIAPTSPAEGGRHRPARKARIARPATQPRASQAKALAPAKTPAPAPVKPAPAPVKPARQASATPPRPAEAGHGTAWRLALGGIVIAGLAAGVALVWLGLAGKILAPSPAETAPEPNAAVTQSGAPAEAPASGGLISDAPLSLQLEAPEPSGGPLADMRDDAADGSRAIDMTPLSAPAVSAGADNVRVFILYPGEEAASEQASALYGQLQREGGYPLVVLRDVDFAISSPRIRYFHAGDAAAAARLARFLDMRDSIDESWPVQDFSHYRPQPAPGTIEVYIPAF